MPTETYKIRSDYQIRENVDDFDDRSYKDEWQDEVYAWANSIVRKYGFESILDIGVGSGFKLNKYMSDLKLQGIDSPKTIEYLVSLYPEGHWLSYENLNYSEVSAQFMICADVIEHLEDPVELLQNIKSIKNLSGFLISTPEREIKWGVDHMGPPPNIYHVREWNSSELISLLSDHFIVIDHKITNKAQGTQCVFCRPKRANHN